MFIAVAVATAALALASCNPKELVVTDTSELKSIALQISNDAQKWEYGEERLFTIVPFWLTCKVPCLSYPKIL